MEALHASGRLTVDSVRITAVRLIAELSPQSRFGPVWADPKKVDELLRAITDIRGDGLDPQDYYLDRLKKLRGELATHPDVGKEVDLDLLLTDALARLAYNAFYGKVDPERIDRNINITQTWTGAKGARGGTRVSGEQIALPADRSSPAPSSQVRSVPPGARALSPIRGRRRLGSNPKRQGALRRS